MDLNARLANQLKVVRGISEALLAVFRTPEEWTHQVHPHANHALWFAGHVGTVDNFMIARLDAAKLAEPSGYRERFGMGSRPTANPADYPPAEEVVKFMRERREVLLGILEGLNEGDLQKPAPAGTPEFMRDVASIFEAAAWHEALHAGQVTVARRSLGHPPMVDAPRDAGARG